MIIIQTDFGLYCGLANDKYTVEFIILIFILGSWN